MLIETLVASVVLITVLLGTFLLLDVATKTSAATRAREGAVTLAREISEDSRAIPFSQLSPSVISTQLQAMPGLANAGTPPTWQVVRRGFTYTVTTTECSIDDPKDGYGQHDTTFCADSTVPNGTTLTDVNPADLKRVTVRVQWTALRSVHTVQEVATLTSSGQAVGLTTSGLAVASPGSLAGSTAPTIASTSITQLSFKVTAPSGTSAIVWTVDGVKQTCGMNTSSSCWTSMVNGNLWTSSLWTISGLSDATYQVGAQAEDSSGIIGPAQTIPVTLIRNIPAAPDVTDYGYNANLYVNGTKSTVAELQWQPNSERNVSGYRIYNPSNTLICTTTNATTFASCGAHAWCSTPSACIDLSPPSPTSTLLTYQVAAVYTDGNGNLQQGPATSVTLSGTRSNTFTFAPSVQNTISNCPGTTTRDMLGAFTPGTDTTRGSGTITFCSDAYQSGDIVQGGGTATAYFANAASTACAVNATLNTDGLASGAVTATTTVPGNSALLPYTFTFTNNQVLTMNTGDRLNVSIDSSGPGCGSTVLHYAGAATASQFQSGSVTAWAPTTPTMLTVTPQPDGTTVLTWPESSGGAPVSFYRVYRDGHDYVNRYDILATTDCQNGTCTYTDPRRTSSHSYYITAVGSTTPGENLAESPSVGPVSG